MTYQDGPGDQRPPGEGPTRPVRPPWSGPGQEMRHIEPRDSGGWSTKPQWADQGSGDRRPGEETAVLKFIPPTSGGGGSEGHVYFNVKFEPRPPAYTAKIVAIYGLTFALHVVTSFVFGPTSELLKSKFWIVASVMLVFAIPPAIAGVLTDHPESVWAKRWTMTVFTLALTAWMGIAGYTYQQFP